MRILNIFMALLTGRSEPPARYYEIKSIGSESCLEDNCFQIVTLESSTGQTISCVAFIDGRLPMMKIGDRFFLKFRPLPDNDHGAAIAIDTAQFISRPCPLIHVDFKRRRKVAISPL